MSIRQKFIHIISGENAPAAPAARQAAPAAPRHEPAAADIARGRTPPPGQPAQPCPAQAAPPRRDIIREIESANRRLNEGQAYKKTTYWHQRDISPHNTGQTDQMRQILEQLNRIEAKVDELKKR